MNLFKLLPVTLRVILLCAVGIPALAQDDTGLIKGRVLESGTPLADVTVSSGAAGKTTTTDAQGYYELKLSPGTYTLAVSHVGYHTAEIKNVEIGAGSQVVRDIELTKNSGELEEVVVSYGRQRQREIIGAIGRISAEGLQDMPVMQFAQQLQGKIAGVQVAQSSGQPGRGVEFRIRGAGSFFSSNQPLFVIDGIPVTGSINNINPTEIESYSILKDASATSLYGSRAANGVVLITTKHAKAGDSKIEFNANYGIQRISKSRLPRPMNAREYAQFMNERYEDMRKYEGVTTPTPEVYQNPGQYGEGTNWYELLTREAPIQSYDIILQSAKEHASSTAILGYQNQQGVLLNNGSQLFSLRFNQELSTKNNKLRVGFNIAPSYRIDHNNRLGSDGIGGLFERVFEASPLKPAYNANGTFNRDVSSPGMVAYVNPLAVYELTTDDYKTTRIIGNAFAEYKIVPGLSAKINAGVDKGAETRKYFQPGLVTGTQGQTTGNAVSVDNGSWTVESTLEYKKTFFKNHNIEALAGYTVQEFKGYNLNITGNNFTSDDFEYLNNATVITGNTTNGSYSLLSTVGRLNYNYKGKYLVSGAVRRDGSSRFGSNRRYGNFPSVSAGWVLSSEPFIKNNLSFLNFLKLRASYGVTGNNFFGNYEAQATVGTYYYDFNNVITPGLALNRLANSELSWERNKQFDLGLDIELLNSRLKITYDYYRKLSDGLIQQRPLPRSSGFSQILDNVGEISFWGHELSINSINVDRKLQWSTSFNISFDRNRIEKLVSPGFLRKSTSLAVDYYRHQEGHSLGEFYGFVWLGLYKDQTDLNASAKYLSTATNPNGLSDVGTIKMKDINGDGVIDDVNDRTFIGDPTPTFSGGLTNNFVYGNFDLNIHMSYSVGGDLMAAAKWPYQTNLDGSRVPLAAVADRWRSPENPGSGIYPRTKTGTTGLGRLVNSQWIEDGSYLTVKNISLGYRVPLKKEGMFSALRVFASVQQAFILTGYSGLNPEVNLTGLDPTQGIGVDETTYAVPRTFSLGLTTTLK